MYLTNISTKTNSNISKIDIVAIATRVLFRSEQQQQNYSFGQAVGATCIVVISSGNRPCGFVGKVDDGRNAYQKLSSGELKFCSVCFFLYY